MFTIASAVFAARGAPHPAREHRVISYFIANEGQWEGDFQFKCEVGSTIYYITPHGMTVDFRSPSFPSSPLGGQGGVKCQAAQPIVQFKLAAAGVFTCPANRDHPRPRHPNPLCVRISRAVVSRPCRKGLPSGTNKLPHYSNYFLSSDSTKWRSRVGHFENVIVPEVWPGIDVEYRADKQGVETIYHVQPGADPTQIQMEYIGA